MREVAHFIPPKPLSTPVLFLIFNRLETTKQVFEAIKKARPPRLYIGADGPRESKEGETEKVMAVREYVMNHIDWECEVKTLFREKNLGCGKAVSEAITWFFENEEMGIILEDDTLPSQSFFWFCEGLLEIYKDDMRVGQISGFNYGYENDDLPYDYLFSIYPMIWGWATWRNRWENYSFELEDFDEIVSMKQFQFLFDEKELKQRLKIFNKVRKGLIDTWDYQWSYVLYKNFQFTVIPKKNYIINLGFGENSTHTAGKNPYTYVTLHETEGEFRHPNYIVQDVRLYNLIKKRDSFFVFLHKFIKRFFKNGKIFN
ncbi:MAG: nucleotide-diphospho-sugar transferase [Brevinematales bacterium]|nr:nucleotide-diphospho-sugar transferase [Brevinematales bacterium]